MADFKIGDVSASNLYMGVQAISRLYCGDQRIWDKPANVTPPPDVVAATVGGSSTANVAYNTASKTIAKPTNLVAGDMILLIASCDYGAGTAFNVPSGFTMLEKYDRGLNLPKMIVGYKIATASEPTTYTFQVPTDADARFDALTIKNHEPNVAPAISFRETPASATVHPIADVAPMSKHGLNLVTASLSGSTTGRTFNWTAPSGFTEIRDSTTNGYQTQTIATRTYATATPTGALQFALTTTSAAMVGLTANIVVPSLNSTATGESTTGPLSIPVDATNGSGGQYTDQKNVTFAPTISGTVRSSFYHIYASHVTATTARGIAFMLHGDGAYEPDNPDVWTVPQYLLHAKRHKLILVVPKSPDRTGSVTWWENPFSTQWLGLLLENLKGRYNVDRNRIWWVGFSGGAQATSYEMTADYHTAYGGGGAFMLGGGSMEGGAFTGTPSTLFKERYPMRWVVGDTDDGKKPDGTIDGDGFNAMEAAVNGHAFYTNAGFRTSLKYLANQDHTQSEDKGPAEWGKFLDEVYGTPVA